LDRRSIVAKTSRPISQERLRAVLVEFAEIIGHGIYY
jgi:hypothetical protein